MFKSKSCASGITRATSSEGRIETMLHFNPPKVQRQENVANAFTNPFPLKFPKRLMHKPTSMTMLHETQEQARKLCLKANPSAHKATMLESATSRRELKSGDFGHLAFESPSKPIRNRQFQDLGVASNRKRPNKDQFNSTCMLASINENAQKMGPQKVVRNAQKKHFKVVSDVRKQMQWPEQKANRDKFQMKYRRVGQQGVRQKPTTTSSSYSSIHLKYKVHK